MINRVSPFIILFFIFFSAIAQHPKKDLFEFKGTVKNGNHKKMYLNYTSYDKVVNDSTIIVNGKFLFKGNIDCPTGAYIGTETILKGVTTSNCSYIYLEPQKMTISLDYNNLKNLSLKGSKTQIEYDAITLIRKNNFDKCDSIDSVCKSYYDQIDCTNDEVAKNEIQNKIAELDRFKDQVNSMQNELDLQFVKQNMSSYTAIDILDLLFLKGSVNFDIIDSLFKDLAKEVQNSRQGLSLCKKLENYRNSKIGSLAPDFIGKDAKGNPIGLSLFRNKQYVLLDFWASWCGPCRSDLPSLKSLYDQYHEKGLEIVSISVDENSDSWQQAIYKEDIGKWKHFSVKENNSTIDQIYGVTAVPVKILINKEGEIIGRWLGGGKQNIDELLEKLNQISEN